MYVVSHASIVIANCGSSSSGSDSDNSSNGPEDQLSKLSKLFEETFQTHISQSPALAERGPPQPLSSDIWGQQWTCHCGDPSDMSIQFIVNLFGALQDELTGSCWVSRVDSTNPAFISEGPLVYDAHWLCNVLHSQPSAVWHLLPWDGKTSLLGDSTAMGLPWASPPWQVPPLAHRSILPCNKLAPQGLSSWVVLWTSSHGDAATSAGVSVPVPVGSSAVAALASHQQEHWPVLAPIPVQPVASTSISADVVHLTQDEKHWHNWKSMLWWWHHHETPGSYQFIMSQQQCLEWQVWLEL